MNARRKILADAVAVLASTPEEQLKHLSKLGLPGAVDELALEYDAIAAAADDMLRLGEINRNQYDSIKKLDELLSRMSGQVNAHLWNSEALHAAIRWRSVREVARECLCSLQ